LSSNDLLNTIEKIAVDNPSRLNQYNVEASFFKENIDSIAYAPKGSIKTVFQNCKIKGCFFHYLRCLWKKANALHLKNNEFIFRTCELITALTLLAVIPLEKIDISFNALQQFYLQNPLFIEYKGFLEYFEKTWLHGTFAHNLWNFYEEITKFENYKKTNNCVESFHNVVFCSNKKVLYI